MRNVLIIGTGLGGLVTGYLLSQYGDKVTLIEQDAHPGGNLQSFYRDGIRFDTGFHFLGGLVESNPIFYFFKELNMLNLPWIQLNGHTVQLGSKSYFIPCGHEEFFKSMVNYFPHEKNGLKHYIETFKAITSYSINESTPYWEQNAYHFLTSTIKDPELRNVLSGGAIVLELNRDHLPLFAYAEILNSFMSSTCRMAEGGQPIIDHLIAGITKNGGKIYCQMAAKEIVEHKATAVGVKLQDGQVIEADTIISSIHPISTMMLLSEQSAMRKVYIRRICNLRSSKGCFTVNIKLKPGIIPMQHSPIYVHQQGADTWDLDTPNIQHLMIHFYPEQQALDFIAPFAWEKVQAWENTTLGARGDDYYAYKEKIVEECIQLAENAIPNIRKAIDKYWSSSPLTWKSYLNTYHGSSYGVSKDCNSLETTLLHTRTPLRGLYLTGQSLRLHGIMGTTISAFQTAATLNDEIPIWPMK